jgi:dipeptidyl-peptidase-4
MDTPANNPEGYEVSKVLNYVKGYPADYSLRRSFAVAQDDRGVAQDAVMLKLTHGTGDDNVHHQNTLQLVDALHKEGKKFDFMIYPDGMHGYYDYQGRHFLSANRDFWLRYLLGR